MIGHCLVHGWIFSKQPDGLICHLAHRVVWVNITVLNESQVPPKLVVLFDFCCHDMPILPNAFYFFMFTNDNCISINA